MMQSAVGRHTPVLLSFIHTVRWEMWGTQIDWATFHVWPTSYTHPNFWENTGIFYTVPIACRCETKWLINATPTLLFPLWAVWIREAQLHWQVRGRWWQYEEVCTALTSAAAAAADLGPRFGTWNVITANKAGTHSASSMEIVKHKGPLIIPTAASLVTSSSAVLVATQSVKQACAWKDRFQLRPRMLWGRRLLNYWTTLLRLFKGQVSLQNPKGTNPHSWPAAPLPFRHSSKKL